VREQQTIVHNVGDEPLVVEQADGSQVIVRPGEKRHARLLDRGDFASAAHIRNLNSTEIS
jgi:tetraacyldisaccharide-1-P 4'-kinase